MYFNNNNVLVRAYRRLPHQVGFFFAFDRTSTGLGGGVIICYPAFLIPTTGIHPSVSLFLLPFFLRLPLSPSFARNGVSALHLQDSRSKDKHRARALLNLSDASHWTSTGKFLSVDNHNGTSPTPFSNGPCTTTPGRASRDQPEPSACPSISFDRFSLSSSVGNSNYGHSCGSVL